MIYPEEAFQKEEKKLALQAYSAVLGPLLTAALLIAVLLLCLPFSLLTTAAALVITAAALTVSYIALQKKLKPFWNVRKYYETLPQDAVRSIRGELKEIREDLIQYDRVMMQTIRLNAGEKIKEENIDTELLIPAVFELREPAGKEICCEAAGTRLTGIEAKEMPKVSLTHGGYAVSGLVIFLMILSAAAAWLSLYRFVSMKQETAVCKVAVCTPAYHEESEKVLKEKAAEEGIDLRFSYSTTMDAETMYQYLATYASFEADLVLLPKAQYEQVFDDETPVLEAVPEGMAVLRSSDGNAVAAVLFDPLAQDPAEDQPSITDWIAIPSEDAYVLCISPAGGQLAKDSAALLLQILSEKQVFR